jgi:hypothetical protein
MDVLEPPAAGPPGELAARLRAGLARAASADLVEITEMGMRHWWYVGALARRQHAGPLPGSSAFRRKRRKARLGENTPLRRDVRHRRQLREQLPVHSRGRL